MKPNIMSTTSPSISIVIPNYNGQHLLEENLPSVFAAIQFSKLIFEIIIVDDASSDDSITFIKTTYPDIQLIINDSNKGFSPTINRGIFAAKNELVLSLNSDVQLSKDYFVEQLKYFEAPDTFGVMGNIKDMKGPKTQDSGKYPSTSFKGIKTTYNYELVGKETKAWLPTFFLSGANALMDRKKLMKLNGYNEIYAPYYYEDADLGIRAWRAGWKCYVEPKSICRHAISSTINRINQEKVKTIAERNRIIINHLHLTGWQHSAFQVWLMIRCISKLLVGNLIIFKALKLYKEQESALKNSKIALEKLQHENKALLSVYDIEKSIMDQLKGLPHRVF